jgi:membrane protein YqaA with SNARE-associated domain
MSSGKHAKGCRPAAALLESGAFRRPAHQPGIPRLLRRLYDWTIRMAGHPRALQVLAAVSFAESSFFPVIPELMLIPMVLEQRQKAWRIATVCTIASVLGGAFGYAIGFYLFQAVGQGIIDFYGLQASFAAFKAAFAKWGFLIILGKGLTPIPYKLVTIASGVSGYNFWLFMLASLVTRGGRFFLVTALLWKYGPPIRTFLERYLTLLATAILVVIVLGFVIFKYLW